ncbi:MAG: sulfatase-like hydrolase/transferase [Mesorhizobium sp.]
MQGLASWDAGQWLGGVGIAAALLLVAWLERRPATWHLGFATFFLLFGVIHLLFPGKIGAMWTTLVLVAVIGAASKLKYRYLGFNLLAGDISHLATSGLRRLLKDYRRLVFLYVSGAVVILASLGAFAAVLREPADSLKERLEIVSAAALLYVILFVAGGGSRRFRFHLLTQDRAHLSVFMASWFRVGLSQPAFVDIDPDPLPLLSPLPPRQTAGERRPHIIMILHESTFDPRRFGLPIDDMFEPFFSPEGSLSGALHVDVFGGGTQQTEFSALTGLSSLSFGMNSRFVYYLLTGRIRHSLPSFLADAGYLVSHVSCDAPASFNCGHFYKSIGIEHVSHAEMLPPPFDTGRWEREQHDQQLFDHALGLFSDRAALGKPCLLSIMTLMNHGDHVRRIFPPERHEELRREAVAATGDAQYGEYIVRLAESVEAYGAFREGLHERLDGQPAIIIRYGDHQPSFTAQLTGLPPSDPALYKTFYAIEAVNCSLPSDLTAPPILDVTYLSTLALLAAQIPLDPVFTTRAALLNKDPSAYFDLASAPKRRFHRALVEAGLVDLA